MTAIQESCSLNIATLPDIDLSFNSLTVNIRFLTNTRNSRKEVFPCYYADITLDASINKNKMDYGMR